MPYPYESLKEIDNHQTIILENFDSTTSIKDLRVGETINSIVREYLKNNKTCVLTYVCDSLDGYALARHRKFNPWYQLYDNSALVLRNYTVEISDLEIYLLSSIFDPREHETEFIDSLYKREVAALSKS